MEAFETLWFASRLLKEWRAGFHLSELNTAIFFLEECLGAQRPRDDQRIGIIVHLLKARLTRCVYTCDNRDLFKILSYAKELQSAIFPIIRSNRIHELEDRACKILVELRQSLNMATLETVIYLYRHALSLWRFPSRTLWMPLNGLCEALSLRLLYTGNNTHLPEYAAMAHFLYALKPSYYHHFLIALALPSAIAGGSASWDQYLGIIAQTEKMDTRACILHSEAYTLSSEPDKSAAILKYQEIDNLLGYYHFERPLVLANWVTTLRIQSSETNKQEDLDEIINLYRRVIAFPIANDRELYSAALASALVARFRFAPRLSDLDDAVALYREVLPQINEPLVRRSALLEFAEALNHRCTLTEQLADAAAGINLLRELLSSRHTLDASEQGRCLAMLANMLDIRYAHRWDEADLEAAIRYRERSLTLLPLSDVNHCAVLLNLANGLILRFRQHANHDDINQAVILSRKALGNWPEGRLGLDRCIFTTATILHERFESLGNRADLEQSIQLHREALELRPGRDHRRYGSLLNLSNGLKTRFSLYRRIEDREKAAEMYREALSLSNLQDVYNEGGNSFSSLLLRRFQELDMPADLDVQEALWIPALPSIPRITAVGNLTSALHARFRMHGNVSDLTTAIDLLRETLLAHKGAMRRVLLGQLAILVLARHQRNGREDDLHAVIDICDEVQTQLGNDTQFNLTLSRLNYLRAEAFLSAYRRRLEPPLLHTALLLARSALACIPEDSVLEQGSAGFSLGKILISMYNLTKDPIHIDEAITSFRDLAENKSLPLHFRLGAARYWAQNGPPLLMAYEYAIGLLPQLAMAGHDVRARHRALQRSFDLGSDGLGGEAAACAIAQNRFDKAVELLEAARSVFWSQALQLRPPLEDLRRGNPRLAARLVDIATQLEQGSMRDTTRDSSIPGSLELLKMEEETSRFRKLNDEWLQAIEAVRKLPGFQNFLRPKPISELKRAAKYGPVVILNFSKRRCDALIVTSNKGVQCVPLPELSAEHLTKLALCMRAITQGRRINVEQIPALGAKARALNSRLVAQREGEMDPNDVFAMILKQLWELIVKPVLEWLKLKKSKMPSRLWWCPTGAFAFLPVHAAGVYEINGDCVSNYVVSSYTPTLSLLLRPFISTKKPFKMTAIIQPHTAGFNALYSTIIELGKIKTRVPVGWLNTLGDSNASPADIDSVLPCLESSSIVHFACHGHQDHVKPLESTFFLEKAERLKMSRIMQKVRPVDGSTKPMSLVFLAACETAQGQESQPDEAMHVAGALLFSGFGGAVATMWTMRDSDGPEIADAFYEQLFKGCSPNSGEPDLRNAASALHVAVQKLRTTGKYPSFAGFRLFISDCSTMTGKSKIRVHEILLRIGEWQNEVYRVFSGTKLVCPAQSRCTKDRLMIKLLTGRTKPSVALVDMT
ncbi:CHAT domain-containing protein [Mycena leptocephala]|nr:CHAT domain-containing protein [Mycena leptocephala]